MACFIVPAVEAAVVKVVEKGVEKKEVTSTETSTETVNKIPLSTKLKWLTSLLIGGSILLAFEHVWHGEVVAWFPFLTAMDNPADAAEMFKEMATVGVSMAVLMTIIWLIMCAVADHIVKRPAVEEA